MREYVLFDRTACLDINMTHAAPSAPFFMRGRPPWLLPAGCVTSLIGLVISFTLSEHSLQSTQPKLTGSEALDASVSAGCLLQLAVNCGVKWVAGECNLLRLHSPPLSPV